MAVNLVQPFDEVNHTQLVIESDGSINTNIKELSDKISDDSNTKLKTSPYCIDEFGEVGRLLGDSIFKGTLITISPEHHEIHCGDSYEGIYTGDLANGASITFAVIVPNEGLSETFPGEDQTTKQYHAKVLIDSEAEILMSFYEGATVSANGTAINQFNRNRNYQLTDFLGFFVTPTVTNTGTLIYQRRQGSGRTIGGDYSRANEWILKDNTIYLITISNETNTNNWYNIEIDYYVHPGV
jgi:hypothetical protein